MAGQFPRGKSEGPATAPVTLLTLFELAYRPERLEARGRAARTAQDYRTMIKWLRWSIGREPNVHDLQLPTVVEFWSFCARRGIALCTIKNFRSRLGLLWRFAAERGLVTEAPELPSPATARGKPTKAAPKALSAAGSLEHFYNHTFRSRELADVKEKSRKEYDTSVREFSFFLNGRHLGLLDVSEKRVDEFHRYLLARFSKGQAYTHLARIRKILRAADPLRFPKRHAHNKVAQTSAPEGSLRHFFETIYLGERELARATRQQYEIRIRQLTAFLGREAMIADLSDELLNRFLAHRAEHDGPTYVRGTRNTLLAIWRLAFEWAKTETTPRRVRKVKLNRRIPDAFTFAELTALVAATHRLTMKAVRVHGRTIDRGAFLRAIIFDAFDSGFRGCDLRALRRTDIDWKTGIVSIVQQKTGVPITRAFRPETLEALRAIAVDGCEQALPWQWRREPFYVTWRRLLVLAGLPVNRRQGLQKVRRSAASHLAMQQGVQAAADLLGHASTPDFAMRYYLDPSQAFAPPPMPPAIPAPVVIAGLLPAPTPAAPAAD